MRAQVGGVVIAVVSILAALVEIVWAVVGLVGSNLTSWVLIDEWAQGPLAIVLIAAAVGLLSNRRWSVTALRVYAYLGVVLGLAAVLSGVPGGVQAVGDVEYGLLSVLIVSVMHFALRAGYAVFLAVLVSRRQTPRWLVSAS